MTDLEMTRLCAEAMGLSPRVFSDSTEPHDKEYKWVTTLAGERWNPLQYDAQAMELVKKLRLNIFTLGPHKVWHVEPDDREDDSVEGKDLNRTIVECVARMQASRKEPT